MAEVTSARIEPMRALPRSKRREQFMNVDHFHILTEIKKL